MAPVENSGPSANEASSTRPRGGALGLERPSGDSGATLLVRQLLAADRQNQNFMDAGENGKSWCRERSSALSRPSDWISSHEPGGETSLLSKAGVSR